MPLERIDECRALLVLDHGFTPAEALCATRDQHQEDRPATIMLSEAQQARLREANTQDVALYDAAVTALENRIALLGDDFLAVKSAIKALLEDTNSTCTIPKSHGFDNRLEKFRENFNCLRNRTATLAKTLDPTFPPSIALHRESAALINSETL